MCPYQLVIAIPAPLTDETVLIQVDGRELILIFLELPPKKIYPDYYQVIAKPIDMGMIEAKIKNRQVN